MSASVISSSQFETRQISKKLRKLAPALAEYRCLIQARFVRAAEIASTDEMNEFGQEVIAYDRWRHFELGRQELCQVGRPEALGNGR
jgi:hypothetical protein